MPTQVPPADGRRPLLAGRLLILTAIVFFALALRSAVTSLTPLLPRISDDIGFDSTIIGVFGTLPTAMFGLAGIIAPALGRKIGLERLALCAAAATAVGTAGRSAMSDVAGLMGFMMLALIGMGLGNVVIPPLIKRYFNDRVALISTVFVCCIQFGTIVPAALAVPIADAHGWRISLAIWALLPLITLLPWAILSRSHRQDKIEAPDDTTHDQLGPIWRSPVAWGLTVMFGTTSLITYAMFTWIPQIITSAGGSEMLGGTMVAVFSLSGFAASFVTPALCAKFANPFPVVIACAVCHVIGFAGLLWMPLTATAVWAFIAGLGPSTFPMAMTLINLRCRTGAGSAALSGIVQGFGYLIACAGPFAFGVLHELTGHWTLSFGFLLLAVVVLLVGGYEASKPRFLEDTTPGRR